MLRIKLLPFGRKHLHYFRISVVEDREKLTSDPAAVIGLYESISKKLTIDREKLQNWMDHGAQPTDSVRKLLGL